MSLEGALSGLTDAYGCKCSLIRHSRAAVSSTPWKAATDSPTTYSSIPCSIRQYKPRELGGLIQEGDQLMTIPVASCPTAPIKGDSIQVEGGEALTVISVLGRRVGRTPAVYKVQVRGAAA